jgi:hypothetical protein
VKPESKFYQQIKKNTPLIKWTRLESWASFGVPDLLGYHDLCGFFMVELKIQTGNKIKFSKNPGPLSSVKLYRSADIEKLISDPRTASPLAENDFTKIEKILINQQ